MEAMSDDLINIPEQTHRWYNVYDDGSISRAYASRELADKHVGLISCALLHLIFEDDKLISSEVEHV